MDWEALLKVACGPLQLKPDEFWRLTPGEFQDLIEGYNWRREQEVEQRKADAELKRIELLYLAWHVAAFQRAKKLPKLQTLLKSKPAKPQRMSVEERQQEWSDLQKDFGLL